MKKENNPQFLTSKQVAERWRCCVVSVHRRKDLKCYRFNSRMLRYKLEDVIAYENAHMPPSSVEIDK